MGRIFRWFRRFGVTPSDTIDCHKWETKVEMFRNLSSRR